MRKTLGETKKQFQLRIYTSGGGSMSASNTQDDAARDERFPYDDRPVHPVPPKSTLWRHSPVEDRPNSPPWGLVRWPGSSWLYWASYLS